MTLAQIFVAIVVIVPLVLLVLNKIRSDLAALLIALVLGLAHGDIVLLTLALAVSMVSFGTGRTNVLTGLVHVVVFVAYLLLIVVP